MKIINPEKCTVFFDFDNTIATCDVFDSMLPHFSKDDLWVELEKKWEKGKIGSRACLEGQIKGLSITRKSLDQYLAHIKLDPYFKKIIKFLTTSKIKVIILSDNFDYILQRILNYHAIKNLRVYSNKLHFAKDGLVPRFPYRSKKCQVCAHCKTKNLLANVQPDSIIIYIGDGRSDICPSQYADIVFAKADLLKHFQEKKLICLAYEGLKDVYDYFKRSFV
ncbi:MAG: MtnX-like HAD-IB family phosphatase [Candidatus Omnitrophica bacterium]|nr:MtnX-like HAD-IB family phosphatase [Candidatus Omnitrophota bacterium]